jgi:hypothetical protein
VQPEVLQIILNSDSKRVTYKDFLGCLGTSFGNVRWFYFVWSWPPLLWGPVTFSFPINFGWLLLWQMHQEEGFKFCLDTWNSRALPRGSSRAWVHKCCVTRWSTLILTWVHNWQVSSCFPFPWVLNTLSAMVGMSWKSYPLKLLKGIYYNLCWFFF